MPRALYTFALYLLTPFILCRLLWRARKAPAYARRWRERFGFVPWSNADPGAIWIHAVSVGETLAAVPVIRALQAGYPEVPLVVTTTTPTGSEQVRKVFGDSVRHSYCPYDLPGAVRRFVRRTRPRLVIIMETELWPNLLAICKHNDIPTVLANARLSEKSARGYRKLGVLVKLMLADITRVTAQAEADAERFVELGLVRDKLQITGNIKFDLEISDKLKQQARQLKQAWRCADSRPVLLAASTHRGEDEIILKAFDAVLSTYTGALLVLVPRHPERFNEVAELCLQHGHTLTRRSAGAPVTPETHVLLGDTMGELLLFCGAADVVFVGGSLVPVGGHNLIEPAAWGVPVLSGPALFNFAEVAAKLQAVGGMAICADAEELTAAVLRLLDDREAYQRMAASAKSVADANRGALKKLTDSLAGFLVDSC